MHLGCVRKRNGSVLYLRPVFFSVLFNMRATAIKVDEGSLSHAALKGRSTFPRSRRPFLFVVIAHESIDGNFDSERKGPEALVDVLNEFARGALLLWSEGITENSVLVF